MKKLTKEEMKDRTITKKELEEVLEQKKREKQERMIKMNGDWKF